MLRGNYKTKLIYGGSLLAAFSLTIGSAWAVELSTLGTHVSQLQSNSQIQCPMPEYFDFVPMQKPKQPFDMGTCNSCMSALPGEAQKVKGKFDAAVASDAAANSSSAANSATAATTSNGQAVVQQGAQNVNGAGAKAGLQQKAANATSVSAAAKECSKSIESKCEISKLGPSASSKVQQAKQACDQLASASDAVAKEKAASSGGMGDMSQLASALGQALGPLAQMMAGQQQPETPATDPYSSGYSTPPTPVAGTSLGNTNNPLAGTTIGSSTSPNGAEFKAAKNNITGFTPSAASNFGPSSGSADSAYGNSSGGGSTGMGSGAYSAGSGGTGLNSSGASMSPGGSDAEKAAAAAAAAAAGENYEVNAAGGGGSRPSFLGLKSRAEEDLAASGESVLGDLGLGEEGSRDLASNEELSGGIGEAEGETLFRVIHTKIAEIKKRGSI